MEKFKDISEKITIGASDYLEEQLEVLKLFTEIDCGTGIIEGNQTVVTIIDELLKNINAEIEHIDDSKLGTHVIGRIKPSNSQGKIIISAHLDTVFKKGDAAKHPFRIEGDMAWGLGIADCKGGVVTAIYSIKVLQDLGIMPQIEIVFIFNCDEEIGSPSGRKIFEKEADGAEAVYGFEPARGENGVITFRPGWGVGQINVLGESAHSCLNYDDGVSATQELANMILKTYEMNKPEDGIYYNVSPIIGGEEISIIPDKAQASFSVTIYSNKAKDIISHDITSALANKKILSKSQVDISYEVLHPPMERTEEVIQLYSEIKKSADLLGQNLTEEFTKAPSDLNIFAGYGATVVDGLGPYMYNIHTFDEHLRISSIPERTALFAMTLAMR